MTLPDQLSLEALAADDGVWVGAGLPESLRRQLDAGRQLEERAGVMRARADRILASIADHQAQMAKLYDELREVLNEYGAIKSGATPSAA